MFAAALSAMSAYGGNLVVGGDFTNAKDRLSPNAFATAGKVSLFQEEYTWNRCGRLEVTQASTNSEGFVVWNAVAVVGSDGKSAGIDVEPGKKYDFSVELRGDGTEGVKAGIGAYVWEKGKSGRHVKSTLGKVVLKKNWTLYKGTFEAPADCSRAGLQLQLWASTRYPPVSIGVGSVLYFDNVNIEEVEDGFAALAAGSAKKAAPAERTKAVASGVEFSDFFAFVRARGACGAAEFPPRVRVVAGASGFEIDVEAEDPKGIVAGSVGNVWSGEAFELHFGAVADNVDRAYTQIAWNPAGARFVKISSGTKPEGDWQIAKNEVDGCVWRSRVLVPYAFLGWRRMPAKGESIAFNASFSRRNGGGAMCWAPVKTGFSDVARFGRLIAGSYDEALRRSYGDSGKVDGRDAYEARVAELETAARQREIDRLKDRAFTVSVVSGDSDFAVPFVPREAFRPATNIAIRAAVNEKVGLPVAILNLTDRAEEYVVRLETDTASADPNKSFAEKQYNGKWGLEGFPERQIVARKALRFKDTDNEPVTLRLEQLPKMDEACTIQVPPKEAGLAWFDFDTAGVDPGVYAGRLRVIPLGSSAKWEKFRGIAYHHRIYTGKMQDVPVSLEVRPIELSKEAVMPSGFFQNATTKGMFDLMCDVGARDFQASPWCFAWEKTPDGHLDYSRPKDVLGKVERNVKDMLGWAKERGIRPTFFVGFSAFTVFRNTNGFRKDFAKAVELWPEYLKGVKRCMNEWGVPDQDYSIEVYDEPDPKWFDEIRGVLMSGKAAVPGVKQLVTLGAHIMSAADMRRLDPYVDGWILWSHGYFSRPEHLAYVAEAVAAGKSVWHYTCSTSGRAPIYETYRLHPWFGWRHGLTGNQFFIFQQNTDGYGPGDFKVAMSSGIAYRSFDSTMPSLRYMSMRRGVEDVKYLGKLREVAGDVPEVREFLESAPVAVVSLERHDKTAPDRMRERAAELILKYGARRDAPRR